MDVIDYFGSVTAAAKFFGVTPQVVNNWRVRNGGLPKSWQITAIEMGIPAHIVRPDLFKPSSDCVHKEMKESNNRSEAFDTRENAHL